MPSQHQQQMIHTMHHPVSLLCLPNTSSKWSTQCITQSVCYAFPTPAANGPHNASPSQFVMPSQHQQQMIHTMHHPVSLLCLPNTSSKWSTQCITQSVCYAFPTPAANAPHNASPSQFVMSSQHQQQMLHTMHHSVSLLCLPNTSSKWSTQCITQSVCYAFPTPAANAPHNASPSQFVMSSQHQQQMLHTMHHSVSLLCLPNTSSKWSTQCITQSVCYAFPTPAANDPHNASLSQFVMPSQHQLT